MTNQGMIDYTGVHSGERSLLSLSFLTEQWVSLKSSHTGRSWMRNHACVDGAPFPFCICTLAPPRGRVQSQAGGGGYMTVTRTPTVKEQEHSTHPPSRNDEHGVVWLRGQSCTTPCCVKAVLIVLPVPCLQADCTQHVSCLRTPSLHSQLSIPMCPSTHFMHRDW